MKCPKCQTYLECPCNSCKDRLSESDVTWEWIQDGKQEFIKCPVCGYFDTEEGWDNIMIQNNEDNIRETFVKAKSV